ncbi:hypothetical protein CSUI_002042 [Cystoisospora suis]|uniref:Transmembrane protein n=1 Tax=Cystoisospora suis TaxID=483139 RepID=A0A2C6LAP3_9APIC|nr:hypothetical protein CSUI_002042 [Cystoisospora suis]
MKFCSCFRRILPARKDDRNLLMTSRLGRDPSLHSLSLIPSLSSFLPSSYNPSLFLSVLLSSLFDGFSCFLYLSLFLFSLRPSPSDSLSEKTAASSPPPSSSSFSHNDSPPGATASSTQPPRHRDERRGRNTRPPPHFLEEEKQDLPGFRPDLVAYCCNSFNTEAPRIQPVVAQYTPVGQPQCIQQTLVVQPPRRERDGEKEEGEEDKKEGGEGGVRKERLEGVKAGKRRGEGSYRRLKEEEEEDEDEQQGIGGRGDTERMPSSRRQVIQRIQTVEPGVGRRGEGEGGVYPSYPLGAQEGMAGSSPPQGESSLSEERKRQEEKNKEEGKKNEEENPGEGGKK